MRLGLAQEICNNVDRLLVQAQGSRRGLQQNFGRLTRWLILKLQFGPHMSLHIRWNQRTPDQTLLLVGNLAWYLILRSDLRVK